MQQANQHKKEPPIKTETSGAVPKDTSSEIQEEQTPSGSGVPLFLQRFAASGSPPPVQREIDEEEHEGSQVFPKLKVGSPDDAYEKEADQVADRVMRMPETPSRGNIDEDDDLTGTDTPVQAKVIDSFHVQASSEPCCERSDEETGGIPYFQAKRQGGLKPSNALNRVIGRTGGGSPIPENTRSRIEPVLNTDLSHVKVYSDTHSHHVNRSIHAKAFTHKDSIFLGEGQRADDLSLMAHEATHVVQQQRGASGPDIQGLWIPEELNSCMDHSAMTSSQLRSRLELVETTLAEADVSSSDCHMLERERSEIIRELSRPQRGGPESSQRGDSGSASANRWTHPPSGITSARGLRIMATPERHPEVVGTQVRYWYDYRRQATIRSADSPPPPSYIREVSQNWRVIEPDGNDRDLGSENEINVNLNRPGRWEIGITLEVADGVYNLWYQHDVIRPADIARNRMARTTAEDFIRFRARLEQERLRLERFSEWGAVNSSTERPYITCSQPNPVASNADPDRIYHHYTMHPSPDGNRYRWYVRASNWENSAARMGYRRAVFGEASFGDYPNASSDIEFDRRCINGENAWVRSAYFDTSYSAFTFIMNNSGVFTIVCEELDSQGNPTGRMARYVQVVLSPREMRQVESLRRHIRHTDTHIAKIREGSEAPVHAVYVNNETGQTMNLSMYIGPDRDNEDSVKLLDLTPGVRRMEYDGSSVSNALDTFNSGNSYPTGLIHLEIPRNDAGIQTGSWSFVTTGSSDWSEWSSGTGWAALTLGVLGVVATFAPIPGARVIAGVCFIGASALGGASAGLSLYDRLQQAEIDETGVAIDVLGIASSIIGGASAFRALRYGATVAIGTRAGRFLLWTGFGTDLASGTLLTIQGVNEINRVMDSDAPRGEKIGAIVRILSTLALNGGLLALSVRDLRTARGRLGGHIGSDVADGLSSDIIHRLNLLDDEALRALRGASNNELERISNLVRMNRDVTNKLARSVGTGVLDHTIESLQGRIRINNQLDIHPGRLAQIADDDLATILRATGQNPVDTVALKPFTQSGSYRLRFRYQLVENENWLRQAIDDAGMSGHPQARRILSELDDVGRMRLQEARTGSIPKNVRPQVENRATRYALSQNPPNAREFVNHYEMFVSEYFRRRNLLRSRIQARMEELLQSTPGMQRAQANRQATGEILGVEIEGFKKEFNQTVLTGPPNAMAGSPYRGLSDVDVTQRSSELSTYLGSNVGPRRVGFFLDQDSLGAQVQRTGNLQFGSESAAVYHTNKHGAELPHDHQLTTFGANPVDRYIRSANETIQGGQAQVVRNQDGSFNVTVIRTYGNLRMRAILRVTESGQAIIATYGKM